MQTGLAAPARLPLDQIAGVVEQELASTPFVDVHTHLFMPSLGRLGLWGIDELITYHYLEAELFRSSRIAPDDYFRLSKQQQADAIWRALFVDNSPVSEAARGVVAVLESFGLDTGAGDLREARAFFGEQDLEAHLRRTLELAGVSDVVMTNDPLDPDEAPLWEKGAEADVRFHPALRLDRILNDGVLAGRPASEVRRFLDAWCMRMQPVYMAVSLPDSFVYPEDNQRGRLLTDAVLPACRDFHIPLSLMIGVRRRVNPALRLAGDALGRADLRALERLCVEFPENRFLVSVLSRENQHELCVYAGKFGNLMPFGCWWFLNNPSMVEEITRERIEMLGMSFIPQHSDARVLEQLVYKWRNTRRTLAPVLTNSYRLLAEDGGGVTRAHIHRDIARLFRGNFEVFCAREAC
ncbi:MAG TPA: glucuronate isomerase [Bryobacteraceae bacterium]|jgi:hypothetical protein